MKIAADGTLTLNAYGAGILKTNASGVVSLDTNTYAPLASPALTGTPTAPTAGATVNTTQLATTAFVQTAVSNLVDSSPGTLNTLNELAAALGDDASFSTTVTTSIGTKLPLAGGTLTGSLILPYLSVNDTAGASNGAAEEVARFVNTTSGATSSYMYIGAAAGTDWRLGKNIIGTASNANFGITKHSGTDIFLEIDGSGNTAIHGTIAASNLSGSNTGDQTLPTLSSLGGFPKASLGLLGDSNVSFGATTNWPNNPTPGFYSTDYVGYTGIVFMTGDVSGSTPQIGLEFAYNGNAYMHSNTDSSAWHSHQIWTENNFTSTNITNWNTAYGWGDHGLSAQDKTDIGNLSGTNTGDQTLPTLSSLGALSTSGGALTGALSISAAANTAWLASITNTSVSGHGLIIQAGGTTGTRYITQWKDAAGTERFHMDDTGEAYFQNTITASGGINGLTLANGGISGTNYNITGVNQLEIADPGEGIVFKAGSSGDMTLAIVDDTADNILRFSGTNATFDVAGALTSTNLTVADGIYHEGDSNTNIIFGTDTVGINTGGSNRISVTDSSTNVGNDIVLASDKTFSLGERFEANDAGRTVLIEGVAGGSSGEGSGRIFFTEHNSSDAGADKYGLSLYYEGNPNALLPSGFQPNTGNATWSLRRHDNSVNGVAIMSGGRTDSNVTFSGTVNVGASLTIPEYIYHNGDSNTYVRFTADRIRIVAGGSTKFDSNSTYVVDSAPAAPTSLSLSVVNDTVNVTFTASATSGIDSYFVFSSVDGGDYSLISMIAPDDFAATMSIIDNAFDATGTQAYRIYAVKNGIISADLTGNTSYSVTSPLEPTNMSAVNLNTAFYIQWDAPSVNARFVSAYNVYKHEHATESSLDRDSATLIYSGNNYSYMYAVSGGDNNNFHKFWVETTIA
jgi:hypothetical protein